ncbi:MAG: phosphatidylinositol mannoside acyltransferase [Nocardioidaceae bacterium]|nr:phosphatidylinositol mannoside acyltransferase [Nocardioidaceae bacterium]
MAGRAPAASARDRLVDQTFAMGWALTRHTPEPLAEQLMERAADRVWARHTAGVKQLERNLGRAVPGLRTEQGRDLSRQAMRSYFRYWHEALRLPSWSESRIVDTVVTANEAPLRTGFDQGRGAIIALPHMANWDLAGGWACLTGMPVSTVAERLQPATLYERFVRYREALGMEVIALTGSGNPLTRLRDSVRSGRLVCLLADRDLTRSGVEVELLGEGAMMAGGAAALARLTGAPLVAMTLSYRGPLLRLHFSDVIPTVSGRSGVVVMTQQIADWFSEGIRESPVDWHMMQPLFTADLTPAADPSARGPRR